MKKISLVLITVLLFLHITVEALPVQAASSVFTVKPSSTNLTVNDTNSLTISAKKVSTSVKNISCKISFGDKTTGVTKKMTITKGSGKITIMHTYKTAGEFKGTVKFYSAAKPSVVIATKKFTVTVSKKYAWTLKSVVQYDTLPSGSENYSCVSDGNAFSLGYTIDQEQFVVKYSWSEPPSVIYADQKVALKITGAVTLNNNMNHSVNTEMSVFFGSVDIDPGFYGGGPVFVDESGNGAIRFGYRDAVGTENQLNISAAYGAGSSSNSQMEILVSLYNGRSTGVKYIYEWKEQ